MPYLDIAPCNNTSNHCSKRHKCQRFLTKEERADNNPTWFDDNWDLYGKFCEEFLAR